MAQNGLVAKAHILAGVMGGVIGEKLLSFAFKINVKSINFYIRTLVDIITGDRTGPEGGGALFLSHKHIDRTRLPKWLN